MKHCNPKQKHFLTKKRLAIAGVAVLVLFFAISFVKPHPQPSIADVWPLPHSLVSGMQTFRGTLTGRAADSYALYWSIDNGPLHDMASDPQNPETKLASVDTTIWQEHEAADHDLTYLAKTADGTVVAKTTFSISVTPAAVPKTAVVAATQPGKTTTVTPISAATPKAAATSTAVASPAQPFAGAKFYVDPTSNAQKTADSWRASRPADAKMLDKIASQPQARWFGGWNTAITSDVSAYVTAANNQLAVPVLVAYNIPQRDCGGYSAGGATTDAYMTWIRGMASGIGNRRAVVILEPDALGGLDCLSAAGQATRFSLLSQAVSALKANAQTTVYLDAGHPHWQSADVMVSRLKQANIASADGFSLNVSNFYSASDNVAYGKTISDKTGKKHFVIDTSRSGAGSAGDDKWCNPAGRTLGQAPTGSTGQALVDAYLWIKTPGDSDGSCNGGPAAGVWWPDYALDLARRS